MDPQYAGDTSFGDVGKKGEERLNKIEKNISIELNKFNLQPNGSKKEKYQILKPPPVPDSQPTWEDLLAHKNDKPLWSDLV